MAAAVDVPYYALGVHSEESDFRTWHPLEEYDRAGVSLISDVGGLLQVAANAMEAYMNALQEDGSFDGEYTTRADLSVFL